MWRRRNNRHEASPIRSLIERLEALEHSDSPSPTATAGSVRMT